MTKEVKGVFVRLPLSEEQVESVLNSYTGDKESTNACMQKAVLDLGTPVTVGELKPVAFMRPNDHASPGVSFRSFDGYIPLVRQSDAQTHIAALEADVAQKDQRIAELEEELSGFRAGLSELIAKEVATLKGGAA